MQSMMRVKTKMGNNLIKVESYTRLRIDFLRKLLLVLKLGKVLILMKVMAKLWKKNSLLKN